jgi:hypothetical protein
MFVFRERREQELKTVTEATKGVFLESAINSFVFLGVQSYALVGIVAATKETFVHRHSAI